MSEIPMIHVWMTDNGPKEVSTMTREELLAVVNALAKERERQRQDFRRIMDLTRPR